MLATGGKFQMNILGSERISAEFHLKKAAKADRGRERERFGLGGVDTVQLKGGYLTHRNLNKKVLKESLQSPHLMGRHY